MNDNRFFYGYLVKKYFYQTVTSTNDVAKDFLKTEKEIIVSAAFQTAGRGRNGKKWLAKPDENIMLTFACREGSVYFGKSPYIYQAAASLAVLNTCRIILPNALFTLKYPNDCFALEGDIWKKVSGALVECEFTGNTLNHILTGIGVNVLQNEFPEELQPIATSLAIIYGRFMDLGDLRRVDSTLCEQLLSILQKDEKTIFQLWKDELNIIGKEILLLQSGKYAIVQEFRSDGLLMALSGDEEIIIMNGDSVRYSLG
jgi:BirA family biotin operon repressor/biotin-[acetyl-CoA-carboxylase] ligase